MTVRQTEDPKGFLDDLRKSATSLEPREFLASVARVLEPGRCQHTGETGFASFADDVRAEVGPLVKL